MKEITTDHIWPPTKKEIKKGLFWYSILVAIFIGISAYKEAQGATPIDWAYIVFFGFFGATACFFFLLLFIHYPLKIVPRIASRAEEKGKEKGNAKSAERGRLITIWGIRIYIAAMLALNIAQVAQNNGKNWGWSLFWFLLTCWLFSLIKQGMKPAKNFMSFLLILGIFSVFKAWGFIGENPLTIYYQIFSFYGFILGLVLIFSRDVNYYISIQYEKLPTKIRDKLDKK